MACVITLLSIPFEIIYLVIFSEFYWFKASGWDVELGTRRTVLVINYIKLFWKILLWPLLWKITIDFEETVRYKTSKHFYDRQKREQKAKRDEENQYIDNYQESDLGDPHDRHILDN